jgi:hypothetical protein
MSERAVEQQVAADEVRARKVARPSLLNLVLCAPRSEAGARMTVRVGALTGFALMCHLACQAPPTGQASVTRASLNSFHRLVRVAPRPPNSERVSLVRILANPDDMNGRAVDVGGYMHVEFEGTQLCLHREDYEQMVLTNCVGLSVPEGPDVLELNDRYVVVEGVVKASARGGISLFPASLQGVTAIGSVSRGYFEELRKRDEEQSKTGHP